MSRGMGEWIDVQMCGWDGKMEEEEWMDIVGLRECGWRERTMEE